MLLSYMSPLDFDMVRMSIVLEGIYKECQKWLFQSSSLNFCHYITADFKPEQIQIVSFITMNQIGTIAPIFLINGFRFIRHFCK